jgi:hypothetical protein
MDFESAMQTFAEAWMAANRVGGLPAIFNSPAAPVNLSETSSTERFSSREEEEEVDNQKMEKDPQDTKLFPPPVSHRIRSLF